MKGYKKAEKSAKVSRTAALVRGFLARKRVAKMRQIQDEEARIEAKRLPLQRRLAKVLAASRVVCSCIIKNAALRRRQRARDLSAAAQMVRGLPVNPSGVLQVLEDAKLDTLLIVAAVN